MVTKKQQLIGKIVSFICLFIMAILCLIPIIWAFGASVKTTSAMTNNPMSLLPSAGEWTWENYQYLFTNTDFPVLKWTANSAWIALVYTSLYLLIITAAAFAFVFIDFKYRNLIFMLVLSSMMIPGIVNTIPLYKMMGDMGWIVDNPLVYLTLIVPGLGGVFGLFIIRSFFLGIPTELVDAAKIDGASNISVFFKVVLPMGKSAIMVAAIFAFMGNWNDYMWPRLMLFDLGVFHPDLLTLPVGLAKLSGSETAKYGVPIAGAIISAIPVMIVYSFTQKYIINGVSRTGLK